MWPNMRYRDFSNDIKKKKLFLSVQTCRQKKEREKII